jgi:aldehyde:ferredoxin oxidoreductase
MLLDSYVGGSFAPEIKFAGYDVVVIAGKASEPVLVLIEDEKVEFVPARSRYWGLETAPLEARIREDMGHRHKVLSIGPAGEHQVPYACLSTDQYHKAGRGGAGAVMGSKNLKAVVVRGTGAVTVPDTGAFTADMLRLQRDSVLTPDNAWTHEEGTPYLVDAVNGAGALPTRNWRTGTFEGAGTINSAALLRMRTRIRACTQCPLACRQVHAFDDYVCEGPEFETLGLCGANCGIGDLAAVAAFNRACDELGLDTISTGAVVALAMDLCEQGAADYGLAFGDTAGYLAAPTLPPRSRGWRCRPTTREGPSAWASPTPRLIAEPATCAPSRRVTTSWVERPPPTRLSAGPGSSSISRTSAPSLGRVCGAPTWPSTPAFSEPTSGTCGSARRHTRNS